MHSKFNISSKLGSKLGQNIRPPHHASLNLVHESISHPTLTILSIGFSSSFCYPFFDLHIHHKPKADGSHANVVWLHCTPSNINRTCSQNLFGPLFLMCCQEEEKTNQVRQNCLILRHPGLAPRGVSLCRLSGNHPLEDLAKFDKPDINYNFLKSTFYVFGYSMKIFSKFFWQF